MKTKKVFGYIFIVIAAILSLAIIGQTSTIISAVFEFFKIFTGYVEASDAGHAIGHLSYWIIHFSLMIILWIYGLRWTKKTVKK